MLKIRLQRIGRTGKAVFRVIVTEHTSSPRAAYLELLGHYDLSRKPKVFEVNEKKIEEWIKKGAKPSSTMARLLKAKGMKNMEAFIDPMPDRKKKNEQAEAAAAPASAAPAPVDAPAKA